MHRLPFCREHWYQLPERMRHQYRDELFAAGRREIQRRMSAWLDDNAARRLF